MSKYTKAIADILGLIKPTTVIFEEEKESLWTAIEALEIADRLEQADVNKAISDYLKNGTLKPVEIVHFANGYNQALADIRGDNNDGI